VASRRARVVRDESARGLSIRADGNTDNGISGAIDGVSGRDEP
jgi:hypothetical protein